MAKFLFWCSFPTLNAKKGTKTILQVRRPSLCKSNFRSPGEQILTQLAASCPSPFPAQSGVHVPSALAPIRLVRICSAASIVWANRSHIPHHHHLVCMPFPAISSCLSWNDAQSEGIGNSLINNKPNYWVVIRNTSVKGQVPSSIHPSSCSSASIPTILPAHSIENDSIKDCAWPHLHPSLSPPLPSVHWDMPKMGCFARQQRAENVLSSSPGTSALLAIPLCQHCQLISPSSFGCGHKQINYAEHHICSVQCAPSLFRLSKSVGAKVFIRSFQNHQQQQNVRHKFSDGLPCLARRLLLRLGQGPSRPETGLFLIVSIALVCPPHPWQEEDLFLRSLLLRQYLDQPSVSLDRIEQEIPVAVNFWRQRRTPSERAKLFRLSDQYTPTPCRWKLCASIFKGAFRWMLISSKWIWMKAKEIK